MGNHLSEIPMGISVQNPVAVAEKTGCYSPHAFPAEQRVVSVPSSSFLLRKSSLDFPALSHRVTLQLLHALHHLAAYK